MVPVEQLDNVNFLNVYYLASEIKREMEMCLNPSKKMTITDHFYQPAANPVYGYPYFQQVRIRTFTYLNNIGVIVDFFHSVSNHKINFTTIPQDEFFDFCEKLAKIHSARFPILSEHETNAKSLSDDQASKLKLVLDTMAFKLNEYGDKDTFDLDADDSFPDLITIPYSHFPSSLEPFDINGLLYKLADDFHLIMKPRSDAKVVSFDFPMTSNRETFYKFKSAIDKRCSAIAVKRQTESAAQSEEKIRSKVSQSLVQRKTADLKVELSAGDLMAYDDGSIRYKKAHLKIRNQLKDLCRLFMREEDKLVTIDDIKEELIRSDKRKTTSNTTISKYVSELHNSLKIHFHKDVIFNQKEEGWYFKP